jgi:hypothetical protein
LGGDRVSEEEMKLEVDDVRREMFFSERARPFGELLPRNPFPPHSSFDVATDLTAAAQPHKSGVQTVDSLPTSLFISHCAISFCRHVLYRYCSHRRSQRKPRVKRGLRPWTLTSILIYRHVTTCSHSVLAFQRYNLSRDPSRLSWRQNRSGTS